MMKYDTLISVASWEDRFELGIKRFFENNSIDKVIIFEYNEFKNQTKNNIDNLTQFLHNKNIGIKIIALKHNNNKECWKAVKDIIANTEGSLVVDITTMPRDIIYYSLFHAENSNKINSIYCMYNSPEKYADDTWLTRDPCKPQLIYNMSGISEMGKNTILIVVTGFDSKRVEQLINYYEPMKIYLYLQIGEQYKNNILNDKQYKNSFKPSLNLKFYKIDAFTEDFGKKEIEKVIIKEKNKSNIIISSLGPKPSSIAIYRLNREYSDIGLVYIPVTKYNFNYSEGLSKNNPIFEKIK